VAGGSKKAIVAALFANAGIAVSKFVGFVITGSASMLAEGVHSCADTGNQALLLLGGRRAKRAPTAEHPFGYGRERYFWSFVVSMVLFTLGGLFAIFEGVEKVRHPHEIESAGWAVGILSVAVVLEALSFRTAIIESNHYRGDASWIEFVRRSKIPELPVVLLEDFGALVGLVIALSAVGLSIVTGDAVFDGWGSILIGSLLCLIAAVLAIEMKSLLIGESASAGDETLIQGAIEGAADVVRLIHLRTEHIGPEELLVGAKVEFSADLSVAQLADAVDVVERDIREQVPEARVIYIEPDISRAAE
jgi:cation diffusion facilitator family transporter